MIFGAKVNLACSMEPALPAPLPPPSPSDAVHHSGEETSLFFFVFFVLFKYHIAI